MIGFDVESDLILLNEPITNLIAGIGGCDGKAYGAVGR